MKDPSIQQATASEPLTIEEEYAMQRSWRQDADKLTFITGVAKGPFPKGYTVNGDITMIGDVNLFVTIEHNDEIEADALIGELELMIAEKSMQGKGLGRSTIICFLQYVIANEQNIVKEYCSTEPDLQKQSIDYYRVKIGKDNERSLKMFAALGFRKVGDVSYFGEIELRRTFTPQDVHELREKHGLEEAWELRYEDPSEALES